MIQKLNIVKVTVYKTGTNGQPLVGKFGPYYKLSLQTHQFPNEYLTSFINPNSPAQNLKENDEIVAIVDDPKPYNGRNYRNFKIAKPEDMLALDVADLKARVLALESKAKLGATTGSVNIADEIPPFDPDAEIKAEDLPF